MGKPGATDTYAFSLCRLHGRAGRGLFAGLPDLILVWIGQDQWPNIIVILADDMGYSDLDCMGSEIKPPNIGKPAGQGMSATDFYNAGRCCPSRASLPTGRYSHQSGIGLITKN